MDDLFETKKKQKQEKKNKKNVKKTRKRLLRHLFSLEIFPLEVEAQ